MDTVVRMPITRRINMRVAMFTIVLMALLGTPIYIFLHESWTGGKEKRGDVWEVNLKALGNFPFDGVEGTINDVPQQWRELDGKRVALVGEMYAPNSASSDLTHFELVYNIQKCCFDGPPRVQERVYAYAPEGKTIPYCGGLARVEGTLRVNAVKQDGKIASIFTMEVASAEPN